MDWGAGIEAGAGPSSSRRLLQSNFLNKLRIRFLLGTAIGASGADVEGNSRRYVPIEMKECPVKSWASSPHRLTLCADVGVIRTEAGWPGVAVVHARTRRPERKMADPRGYKSFAEFTREALRPGMRAGWSIDELDVGDDRRELDFDLDPFEQALVDAENEDDDDY